MKVRFLEAARDDLRDAVRYYEIQRPGLGKEFADELRAAIRRIRDFPSAWQPLNGDMRRCLTRRFPYGVIYQLRIEAGEETVLILAVAHLHRAPEGWRNETEEGFPGG